MLSPLAIDEVTREHYVALRQELHELAIAEDRQTALATIPSRESAALLIREGWAHDKAPEMMRDVMSRVHGVITSYDPSLAVWGDAVGHFITMVRTSVQVLQPRRSNSVAVTNNVMLDTLRQLRVG